MIRHAVLSFLVIAVAAAPAHRARGAEPVRDVSSTHHSSLWRLRNLAGGRSRARAKPRRIQCGANRRATPTPRAPARLPGYWRTQRMRAIQATSPFGRLRLDVPPLIDLSSIF